MRDATTGGLVLRPERARTRCSGWLSRLVLLAALGFGLFSPYRAAPRAAEIEEVESCSDATESETAAHARATHRNARRSQHGDGPARARIELVRASIGPDTGIGAVPRPRWQLPRRCAPPDDDPLG